MSGLEPSYLRLHAAGELAGRAARALSRLESCDLCPRRCGANRLEDERGDCETGRLARISSTGPHFGEEAPLVGRRGSGTVFFSGCNLGCTFCQNAGISQLGEGGEVSPGGLAAAFLTVQALGCHNLNLVTPTHATAQILEALPLAVEGGLRLPIVYNCGGYESPETLELLDGVVDVYMPDLKYSDPAPARAYSHAPDYPEVARTAIRIMHSQVGDLTMDGQGVARRGLLIRHLVLPAGLAGTADAMRFLAEQVSPDTYVNVMSQYRPCHEVHDDPALGRPITTDEFKRALREAREAGIHRLDDPGERIRVFVRRL